MTQPASCRSEQRNSGRVVPTLVLDGAEQMALDALLLEGVLEVRAAIPRDSVLSVASPNALPGPASPSDS